MDKVWIPLSSFWNPIVSSLAFCSFHKRKWWSTHRKIGKVGCLLRRRILMFGFAFTTSSSTSYTKYHRRRLLLLRSLPCKWWSPNPFLVFSFLLHIWYAAAAAAAAAFEPGFAWIEGHWKLLPERSMSLIRVSIGVFPTSLTKKSCSMTDEETVRSEGRRRSSLPNRVGWFGYWLLQYSSSAHWDFSWSCSITWISESPHASAKGRKENTL